MSGLADDHARVVVGVVVQRAGKARGELHERSVRPFSDVAIADGDLEWTYAGIPELELGHGDTDGVLVREGHHRARGAEGGCHNADSCKRGRFLSLS